MPNVAAVVAKMEAADAESAPEASPGAPPPGGDASGADSALGGSPEGAGHDPTATSTSAANHDELKEKLRADRDRRGTKHERRKARLEREKLERATAEAEAAKKAADEERAKLTDRSRPWKERIADAGEDPLKVFEEMMKEAREAGTPEAQLKAMEKAFAARIEATEKKLEEERAEREAERKQVAEERERAGFISDFQRGIGEPEYATLLDEYEPPQLFQVVETLKKNPPYLFAQAKQLGVALTDDDGSFTMIDILNVMKATTDRHNARKEQRRTQSAAPHASETGRTQPAEVEVSTVNGAAVRKPGTIGNDLAASRATETDQLKGMTHEQRSKYLQRKYGGA